jgi:Uma2 family endonuclease
LRSAGARVVLLRIASREARSDVLAELWGCSRPAPDRGPIRCRTRRARYRTNEIAVSRLPEYELRVADVGYLTRERWEQIEDEDYCLGAPDLTIEVLSPSTTAIEIDEKAALCLANGCREFWVVDRRLRQITVSRPDGLTHTYRAGESIPLALAENQPLMVDSVFVDK